MDRTRTIHNDCRIGLRIRLPALAWIVCFSASISPLAAQNQPKVEQGGIDPGHIPGVYQRYAKAPGNRLRVPGKERLVLSGELTLRGQRLPLSAILELSGKVRLQYGQNKTVVFDLDKADNGNSIDDDDEALLDMFAYDTAENFLHAIADGSMPRVLGYAFQSKGATGFGSSLDTYEVVQSIKSRKQTVRYVKLFQFDTQTALLHRITYTAFRGRSPVRVNTEYSQYQSIAEQKIATRITRRENGTSIMDIRVATAQVQSKGNDNDFKIR